MNIENIELIVNELVDDCEVRENYNVDGGEVLGYNLGGEEYKFICINNVCVVVRNDFMYDVKVVKICKNDDELKEFLSNL